MVLDSYLYRGNKCYCLISTYFVDGMSELREKIAINLTAESLNRKKWKEPEFSDYITRLTGKFEYSAPNTDLDSFEGWLKLRRDPKVEYVTNQNFIPRGSVLKSEGYLYGLVVYTG